MANGANEGAVWRGEEDTSGVAHGDVYDVD